MINLHNDQVLTALLAPTPTVDLWLATPQHKASHTADHKEHKAGHTLVTRQRHSATSQGAAGDHVTDAGRSHWKPLVVT